MTFINKLFSLKNKVAVITGGSGDLGFAIASGYWNAGATVILAARDRVKLDKAIRQLAGEDRNRAYAHVVDVANSEQVEKMMSEISQRFGKIDILVTAAGIQHRSSILSFEHKAWNDVLTTNLTGTFYCAQIAARVMTAQAHGRIVMISSLTAEIGIPNIAAYAASRGGIRQLCKTMAVELAGYGITVNCIGPGRFKTRMTEDLFANKATREKFLAMIPMRRAGVPADLTGISIFLASDSSSYVTGQTFYIDGGWLAGGGNILG